MQISSDSDFFHDHVKRSESAHKSSFYNQISKFMKYFTETKGSHVKSDLKQFQRIYHKRCQLPSHHGSGFLSSPVLHE
jgi:hypothetical protein